MACWALARAIELVGCFAKFYYLFLAHWRHVVVFSVQIRPNRRFGAGGEGDVVFEAAKRILRPGLLRGARRLKGSRRPYPHPLTCPEPSISTFSRSIFDKMLCSSGTLASAEMREVKKTPSLFNVKRHAYRLTVAHGRFLALRGILEIRIVYLRHARLKQYDDG